MPDDRTNLPAPDNEADLRLRAGPVAFRLCVSISDRGLIAIAGLVTGVLLSTSLIVWTATTPVRRHPLLTRFGR